MERKTALVLSFIGSVMALMAAILGLIENRSISPYSASLLEIGISVLLLGKAIEHKDLIWLFSIQIVAVLAVFIANFYKLYAIFISHGELPVTSYTMLLLFILLMMNVLLDNFGKNASKQPEHEKQ